MNQLLKVGDSAIRKRKLARSLKVATWVKRHGSAGYSPKRLRTRSAARRLCHPLWFHGALPGMIVGPDLSVPPWRTSSAGACSNERWGHRSPGALPVGGHHDLNLYGRCPCGCWVPPRKLRCRKVLVYLLRHFSIGSKRVECTFSAFFVPGRKDLSDFGRSASQLPHMCTQTKSVTGYVCLLGSRETAASSPPGRLSCWQPQTGLARWLVILPGAGPRSPRCGMDLEWLWIG